VQSSETVPGPIEQIVSPTQIVATNDSSQQAQEQLQEQQQAERQQPQAEEQSEAQKEKEKDKDKEEADSDDGSTDASLGLINSGPVQVKTDLEQPVTSGGMDNSQGPGPSD
jgi:hypothetical protein